MGSLTQREELEASATADDGWSAEAIIYVNGIRRVLPDGLAHLTLLQYLRGLLLFRKLDKLNSSGDCAIAFDRGNPCVTGNFSNSAAAVAVAVHHRTVITTEASKL